MGTDTCSANVLFWIHKAHSVALRRFCLLARAGCGATGVFEGRADIRPGPRLVPGPRLARG